MHDTEILMFHEHCRIHKPKAKDPDIIVTTRYNYTSDQSIKPL